MKDIKNIIIQNLNDFQKGLVHQAMACTGQGAASKAIFQVLSEHMEVKKELFVLKSKQVKVDVELRLIHGKLDKMITKETI